MEEYLKSKTKDIEKLHIERRHASAWETIREITNKKSTPMSRIKGNTKDIEKLHIERRHASAWETIREITNKKSTPMSRIKGNTKDERLKKWHNHFNSLLGSEENIEVDIADEFYKQRVSDLPIDTKPFTMKELKTCLAKVRNQKSAGPYNIPAIIWKHPLFHKDLFHFCNETFKGNKPSSFTKSCMFTIAKKGDLQNPNNYRGITLSAIASKIYNSLLLNRLSKYMEPIQEIKTDLGKVDQHSLKFCP